MSTASTASETSVIETESSITSATSSGYTTVTSTTSAASAKPSSTPDAETPTSDLTVPSTTTTTDAKTESPPLPSPPCFGDFIFVIDGSTNISQSLIWAVKNITGNWNFNDTRKLRVSAAASGLSDPDNGYFFENFANTSNDWSGALARMGTTVNILNAGDVTPPTSLATTLEDTYCKEDAINPVVKGTNVTIIIFTSWSDGSLIDEMKPQQRPWLSCSLASRTNVFMVGICDAASNLRRLALPSEDLYIDMEYCKFASMNDLVNNVIAKTCECAVQGSIPVDGCPYVSSSSNYSMQLLLKSSFVRPL
uniref:VWFA domain-containing protein n=1 Tax=Parascaris univalens TaxID=6257 RepID=A0A915ALJ5_PARUN